MTSGGTDEPSPERSEQIREHGRQPSIDHAGAARREWVPGTFPNKLANLNPITRRSSWLREQLAHNPLGLFGFYTQGDVTVVTGDGLGGGSLINCSVVMEPEEDVFRQPAWPAELRSKTTLRPYFDRAHCSRSRPWRSGSPI